MINWKDDYGTVSGGTRQRGNAIGVAPGTPVVATAAGRVRMLWRGGGGWSVTLTTPTGDQFVYLHLGRDGNRKSAYLPGLRDGKRVSRRRSWASAASRERQPRSRNSGSCTCRRRRAVDPYELLASARGCRPRSGPPPVERRHGAADGHADLERARHRAALLRMRTASIAREGRRSASSAR